MTLRKLTFADTAQAIEVQSLAFEQDPLWVYAVPNVEKRRRLLRQTFTPTVRLGILNGQAYGIGSPTEGLVLWRSPTDRPPVLNFVKAGFWRLLVNPAFLAIFPKVLPVFLQFGRMQKRYASDPHYYLETISIAPTSQGKGLASTMIRPFLEKADAEGVGVYTETVTPSNVGLYEHYGLRVVEEYAVPKTPLKVWGFYRPRQTKE
jgi:ribosomal protein S18 acetylase RimI-like enzyme